MNHLKKISILILFLYAATINAACDDPPKNEVDWSNCNFVENLDLAGVGLAKSEMSGVNLSLANFLNGFLISF